MSVVTVRDVSEKSTVYGIITFDDAYRAADIQEELTKVKAKFEESGREWYVEDLVKALPGRFKAQFTADTCVFNVYL